MLLEKRAEADSLFSLGYLPLEEKAVIEKLYWAVCRQINDRVQHFDSEVLPPELDRLDSHSNRSVPVRFFQSSSPY